MYITPASGGTIVNSAELVNAMALEYTQPDSFIGGGLQRTGEASVSAYFVCVNALYQSVRYGKRFRIIPSVGNTESRRLSITPIYSSVVKSLLQVDSVLYVLISWNASQHSVPNRVSIVKTDLSTGDIVQQVHLLTNTVSLYCTDMNSAGLYIVLACSMRHSTNITQPFMISADRQLTFSELPSTVWKYTNTIFAADSVAFHRTKIPVSVENTVITTTDYTFSSLDGSPTVQPTTVSTSKPSVAPSGAPSGQPSSSPSAGPSVSPQPSSQPSTSGPTNTYKPTVKPSLRPTSSPTVTPTVSPSNHPTQLPTARPTLQPSRPPTPRPSVNPTILPSRAPQCKPTLKPTAAPTVTQSRAPSLNAVGAGLLAESVDDNSTVNETVFILLYVLGGLTALYGLYRASLCYLEALEEVAWQRRKNTHRKEVQLLLADQPTRIPIVARRLAVYKKSPRGVRISIVGGNHVTQANVESVPPTGAYATGIPISPSLYNHQNSEAVLNTIPEESSAHQKRSSVASSSSSSVVLSSLHSSEMSDVEFSIYSASSENSLTHHQSSENVMEEGGKLNEP